MSGTGAVSLSVISDEAVVSYKINFLLRSMPGVTARRGGRTSQLDLPRLLQQAAVETLSPGSSRCPADCLAPLCEMKQMQTSGEE